MIDKIFEYEALVGSGESIKGVFEGSKENFTKMVSQKRLTIINIKEIKKKLDKSKFNSNDFLDFIEELYYLSNSGMGIDQSLKILIKTAGKESQIRILKLMLNELKNGSQLSVALKNALKKEKVMIDSLSIGFIATAEEVGDISNGLYQLFEYLSFQKKVKSDIFQALAYPAFLIIMSIGVAFLIFFLIIPRFSTIFSPEEFEKLPTISYTVLSLGKYLNAHAGEFFLIFFALIALLYVIFKRTKISWITVFYKLPKLSSIIIDLQLTIVYSALSTMLVGGLELDKALRQLQKINLLPELKNLLKNTLYEIKRGQRLSTVFAISKVIPPSDIALLHVGENSASLDKVFKSLSIRHSDSFSAKVKKFLSLLEPIVIVGLGIFIAVIVVAIMMAVMSTTDIVS
jgi:type II secretory pathway component PulF